MKEKILVVFSFTIVVLLAFIKLGKHPISPWDEARRGINAIEMLRTCDFVNLRFCGQLDTWNNKPPLAVWFEAVSFKLLGFNELALRLPSALAIVLAFFVLFKITTLYRSASFAALVCLVLASVKGLIGWHVGRTGDTDALLVLFHLVSIYCFLQFIDFEKKWAALGLGLSLGLGFLTKGAAAFTLLPGMALYAFINGKNRHLLTIPAWSGLALACVFTIGWGIVQSFYGIKTAVAGNALDRQFSVDLVKRFTEPADGWKEAFDFTFIFTSLDKIFNLWHYAFFGCLTFGLILLVKDRRVFQQKLLTSPNRLLLFSHCVYWPLALFLAIAAKSNRWYLAPAISFVGIITMWGIAYLWNKIPLVKWVFLVLLVFTLSRQFLLFWQVDPKPALSNIAELKEAETIYIASNFSQDILCYLYFYGKEMRFGMPKENLRINDMIVILRKDLFKYKLTDWKEIDGDEHYIIVQSSHF